MLRITAAVLLCLTFASSAHAAIPCWKVKAAIAWAGSVAAAEALASQNGYSARDIAEARKCLKR